MSYATCDHLKEDGVYCQSPALLGHNFCYFHLNIRARRVQMVRARSRGDSCRFQLPVLDNMHAVLLSLQQVADALADDRIESQARRPFALHAPTDRNRLEHHAGMERRTPAGWALPSRCVPSKFPTSPSSSICPRASISIFAPDAALDAAEQPADAPQTTETASPSGSRPSTCSHSGRQILPHPQGSYWRGHLRRIGLPTEPCSGRARL